jgi:hypothetical protein
MKQKGFTPIAIIVIVAILGISGYFGYQRFFKQKFGGKNVCTLEAKVCPDGTSVGRTGPDCEFSSCPTPSDTPISTADWKTYTNTKYDYSFKYPSDMEVSVCSPELVFPVKIIRKYDPCGSDAGGFHVSIVSIDLINNVFLNPNIEIYDKVITETFIDGRKATLIQSTKKPSVRLSVPDKTSDIIIYGDKSNMLIGQIEKQPEILSTFKFTDQPSTR